MSLERLTLATLTLLTALGLSGLGILAMPDGGPLAAWCRPGGELDFLRAMLVLSPLVAAGGMAALRWRLLAHLRSDTLVAHGIAVAVLTGLIAGALAVSIAAQARGLALPDATLVDQDGQPFALGDLRGSPAVVGAVYSRCSTACPMALAELTAILGALTPEERLELHVVMITLDPWNDTPARLHEMAAGHGLSAPSARFLTGDVQQVEGVLDSLGFERRRDPATGLIEHEAVFVLVGADGRVAGRYASGGASERQLVASLRALLARQREAGAPPAPSTSAWTRDGVRVGTMRQADRR